MNTWPAPTADRAARPVPILPYAEDQTAALAAFLGIAQQQPTTPKVSATSVRGLPAAGFCVDLIANACALMLLEAKCYDEATGEEVDPPAIVANPYIGYDEYDYWYQVVASIVMQGNYIGLPAAHDEQGLPRQVVPIPLSAVSVDQTTGLPVYTIVELGEYDWSEVIHVGAKRPVGSFWGMGAIEQYRRQWNVQLHQQSYELNSHATGGVPAAVVTLDVAKVDGEVAKQVQDDWIERHGAGQRKPAVVPRSMKIEPLSWSPEDAEFIESRQLAIAEAAYMIGLNPADIGAAVSAGGGTITYENLTARQIARLVDSYQPWLSRIERTWSRFTPGIRVRGDVEALMRMTPKERLELRKLSQEIGIETPDESRELEGRKPAPTDQPDPSTQEDGK